MGKKKNVGTFAYVANVKKNKLYPDWAEARLSVTVHGDGVFTVASSEFFLTEYDLQLLVRMGQEVLDKIKMATIEEEN